MTDDQQSNQDNQPFVAGWIDQMYSYDPACAQEHWQAELFGTVNGGGQLSREVLLHGYEFVGSGPQDQLLEAEYVVAVLPEPKVRNDMRLVIFSSGESVCWKEAMVRFASSRLTTRESLGSGTLRCQQEDWQRLAKLMYDMEKLPLCFIIFARRADVMNHDGTEKPNIRLFFPVKPYKIYATFALGQLQQALVA